MKVTWRDLRLGDRIRFLRVPSEYSHAGYQIAPQTLALYSLLISTGDSVEIDDFVDGKPLAGYVDRRNPSHPHFHGLMIDDTDEGCWELVSELPSQSH